MGRKNTWFPWKREKRRLERHNGVKLRKIDGDSSDLDEEAGGRRENDGDEGTQKRIMRDGLGEEITKEEKGEGQTVGAVTGEEEAGEEEEEDGINEVFEGTSFQIMAQEKPVIKTVKDAVVNSDVDRLNELLAEDSPIGDALLNAVAQSNQLAVQTICDHIAASKEANECYQIINRFAQGPEFLPSSTALQIAAKGDNFEIVQILIRNGAILPDLKKCLQVPGVKNDEVVQCFAFLQYVKAAASPSLILLTETNPVGRAFRIAIDLASYSECGQLTRMLKSHPNFTQQIEDVVDGTEDLLCKLLDQCKSRREIQAFLQTSATPKLSEKSSNQRTIKHQHEDSSLPPGLEQAISNGFKKLVAHPFSQMIVTECVFHGPVNWDDMRPATFLLMSSLVIIFSPVLCLSYSLCPVKKLVEFMQTPYVRVLNAFSSYLLFLFFLLLTSINIDYINTECPDVGISRSEHFTCSMVTTLFWPIYGRMVLIGIIVFGQLLWLSSSIYKIGLSSISAQSWHWVVLTQTLLFAVSLVAYLVSYVQVETYIIPSDGTSSDVFLLNRKPHNTTVYVSVGDALYQPSRGDWNSLDAQIVGEITFALANILTVQRLLHTCIFFERVGPLIISIGRMLSGILKFALVAFLILMSFSLGFTQLFAPYVDLQPCEDGETDKEALRHCGDASMFTSVQGSLNTLFWAIFGEFHITDMSLPGSLSIVQYTGQILHAIYIIMTSIILLNMLVAAMLTTYDSIQGNVYTEWKFSRTNMMREYCGHRSNVPVPFNLFPSVRVIFGFLTAAYRKIIALFIYCGIKVPERAKEQTYHKWKRKSADGVAAKRDGRIKFKERHQVMQTIVERYKHIHWQTSPASWDLRLSHIHSARPRSTQSITSYAAVGLSGVGSRHNSVSRAKVNDAYSPTLNTNTTAAPPNARGPYIERVPSLKKAYSVETMPFVRGASSLRSLPPYSRKSFNEPQDGHASARPIIGPHRGAIRKKHRPGSISLV